jgi:adenylate cyclase
VIDKFIGDAVNVAARVEAETRETEDEVLITASTHGLLHEEIEVDRRGPRRLKGKQEPVELFAPVVEAPTPASSPAT